MAGPSDQHMINLSGAEPYVFPTIAKRSIR